MDPKELGIDPDVIKEHAIWCSFCNAEPSIGEVSLDFPIGDLKDIPIGANCKAQADAEGFHIETLDSSVPPVLE